VEGKYHYPPPPFTSFAQSRGLLLALTEVMRTLEFPTASGKVI
jgi:hypothetical protein